MKTTEDLRGLLCIWGKTTPEPPGFKPLLHHMLDVAATAEIWQRSHAAFLSRLAKRFGLDAEALISAHAFLAALHDLGKCSAAFQAKAPELWPEILGPRPPALPDRAHWRITAMLCRDPAISAALREMLPGLRTSLQAHLVAAVAGHHGRPPDMEADSTIAPGDIARRPEIGAPALAAARSIVEILKKTLHPAALAGLKSSRQAKLFSWHLAGLATLADWVGSDIGHFPPLPLETPLSDYLEQARGKARAALSRKGLMPARANQRPGLSAVAPTIAATAHPMQEAAESLPLPRGPCLFIIEDATGSGKTEAALALASRLIAADRANGLYFALPTEATANAMFERLRACHRGLFASGEHPSLVLAHGRAALSEPFAEVRQAAENPASEDEVSAQCAAWIADHRRKAFFAHVGAGTIDQAFLAILPKRFLTLRQIGLADKVLVVDEAHAFDAYMGVELWRLLEMQANAAGSAIVLSATLPASMKQKMMAAFAKGLGCAQPAADDCAAYPLLSVVSEEGARTIPVAAAEARRVSVERLDSLDAAHEAAREAAERGAAVLFIRNAVAEAARSAAALQNDGLAVDLFHARFAACDRERKERQVLERFGRDASPAQRAGRVLVATQVAEQSLDLDFDLVISDLAPIDLLIQRAGRLWRHMTLRDEAARPVPGPRLLVLSPDPDRVESADWLRPLLGDGAYVYGQSGVMWRTARTLFATGAIETPAGLRPLIEAVYADDALPDALVRIEREREGALYAMESLGRWNTIRPADGYLGVQDPSADQEVGTRLGREMTTLRLARLRDGKIEPWAGDGPQAWARSEVSVPASWLCDLAEPAEFASVITAVRVAWPKWERAWIAIVETDGRLILDGKGELRYSAETGLRRAT